jgi:hypothetical protein
MLQDARMTRPTLLVLSPRETMPEPLHSMAARGDIVIQRVCSCHEAAAETAIDAGRYAGILADSDWLSLRELEMLNVIQRHAALPIWTLPASTHPKPVTELGLLPWEAAVLALAQLLQQAPTIDLGRSNNKTARTSQMDSKTPDNPTAKPPEIPLASDLAARYDGLETPVLSRSEIAALLGTAQ